MRKVIIRLTHDELASRLNLPPGIEICQVGSTEFGKNSFPVVLKETKETEFLFIAADVDSNPDLEIPSMASDEIVDRGLEQFDVW